MAINLTVALTDAEQAYVEQVASRVAPGATAAQIKAWAEKKAKAGLREAVVAAAAQHERQQRDAALAAAEAAIYAGFPDPNAS